MRRILVSIVGIFVCFAAFIHCADITWDNDSEDGKWSTATNWSSDSVPGSNDKAVFDGSQTDNCSIDDNVNVKGIDIQSGYTGTITQATGKTITVGSDDFTIAGGTFTGGDSTIDINTTTGDFTLSGGTFTSTSGTMNIGHDFTISGGTFNHNSGKIKLDYYNKTVNIGSTILNDLEINMGTYSMTISGSIDVNGNLDVFDVGAINSGNIKVAGHVTTTDDAVSTSTGAYIEIDGSDDQTLGASGGTGQLHGVKINKSGGTLTIQDTIAIQQGGWTYSNGTVVSGSSTVKFVTGSITIDSNGMSFNNVEFNAGSYGHTCIARRN